MIADDDLVRDSRRKDTRLRAFAYGVLSLVTVAGLVTMTITILLLVNTNGQRSQLLAIASNTQAAVDRLDAIVSSQPAANAAIATVVADLESELLAVCSAVNCHGVVLHPFTVPSTTTTNGGRSAPQASFTTATTRRPVPTTTSTSTTRQPPSTTTTSSTCVTLPNRKCLLGGAHATSNK